MKNLLLFYFLFRAVGIRHLLQHHSAEEDAVLHGEFDYPVRGHLVPVGVDFLSAGRLWGKSGSLHYHFAVADHVLPAHVGNHPVNLAGHAPPGQIPALHHVSGGTVCPHHHRHPQRPLP